jgi:hypothetical protein
MRTLLCFLAVALGTAPAVAQSREEKVRDDKAKVEKAGVWIYNDLPKALRTSRG